MKASDTRAFREMFNAMLKNLPAGLASFNVKKDDLLSNWSRSEAEPLIYVTKNKRLGNKRKIKTIRKFVKTLMKTYERENDNSSSKANNPFDKAMMNTDSKSLLKVGP